MWTHVICFRNATGKQLQRSVGTKRHTQTRNSNVFTAVPERASGGKNYKQLTTSIGYFLKSTYYIIRAENIASICILSSKKNC